MPLFCERHVCDVKLPLQLCTLISCYCFLFIVDDLMYKIGRSVPNDVLWKYKVSYYVLSVHLRKINLPVIRRVLLFDVVPVYV